MRRSPGPRTCCARGLREADGLARLGGDEFAVLLQHADAREACLVTDSCSNRCGQRQSSSADARGHSRPALGSRCSDPRKDLSGEDVLVNADLAMYDAKHAGRDRAELYAAADPGGSEAKGRGTWAQRIGKALHHDGFVLLAQPIVDLATSHTGHYELLLRMRDERGDLVLPGAFLRIAERPGMVQEIDRWVTKQAITSIARARARRGAGPRREPLRTLDRRPRAANASQPRARAHQRPSPQLDLRGHRAPRPASPLHRRRHRSQLHRHPHRVRGRARASLSGRVALAVPRAGSRARSGAGA
ncbi:MAG: EAL domain-containing protein [Solirubrobacteraceae bacterium]